jgi:Subtilase family
MKRHYYLKNDRQDSPSFKRTRGFKLQENDLPEVEPIKVIDEEKKSHLRTLNIQYFTKARERRSVRKFNVDIVIDFIQIRFYKILDTSLRNIFFDKYGLFPIKLDELNHRVLFEIKNSKQFKKFFEHLNDIISSDIGTTYSGKDYNLLALINDFIFFDSSTRLVSQSTQNIILDIATLDTPQAKQQLQELKNYANAKGLKIEETISSDLQIETINRETLKEIVDNFDIILATVATKITRVGPSELNLVDRKHVYAIDVPDNLPTVAVLDTGVSRIPEFDNILINEGFDHTGSNMHFFDNVEHGTSVAGLVAFGAEPYLTDGNLTAKAKIFTVKVLDASNGSLDINKIIFDIVRLRKEKNIRLFNLSIVIPISKRYNEIVSLFAYQLDLISHLHDLLVFISVGNFDVTSLKERRESDYHIDHDYPTFFYKPKSTSHIHNCVSTNICSPADSYNNISVGALAGNFENFGAHLGATPDSKFPAYYTLKYHLDFKKSWKKGTKNKHLNKPDLVYEGGDYFDDQFGLEVFSTNGQNFRTCGTSLATPFVTSICAELLSHYPTLRTQTLKALLINSASYDYASPFKKLTNSSDALLKGLIGFGKPSSIKAIEGSNNSICLIIEDDILDKEIMAMPIILPAYLQQSNSKLDFDITLCFSFNPIKDNQLDYLPTHIAFNVVQNVSIETIANGVKKIMKDTKRGTPEYGIKNFTWSEDFFGVDGHLFSNSQKMNYRLQPTDLKNIREVALAIRCLCKNDYAEKLKQTKHSFSLILTITEIKQQDNSVSLYDEFLLVNSCVEISNTLDLTNTADEQIDLF